MSNTQQNLESLLHDLQSKYAFQEDFLASLNETVISQGRLIERLEKRCDHLKQMLDTISNEIDRHQPAADERPPHY